jgi:hypothetical protein
MTMSKSVTAERTQWANRISAAWQKSVDSIIETGRLLLAAKADPKMQEFDRRAGARTFLQARRRRRRSSPPRRSSHTPDRSPEARLERPAIHMPLRKDEAPWPTK